MSQSPTNGRLHVDAPAKLNLFLHVTGRRENGYHLLDSLVAFTEFGDRVSVEMSDDLTLSVEGPFASELPETGDDNLVLRAARALRDAGSVGSGARIVLEKNLPVSSGIGGGSTDAAAAIRALSVLWGTGIRDRDLAELGIALGADVPVCLNARPSMMTGVGEHVENVTALPPCGVVLINAREGVSTPAVFSARQGDFSRAAGWPGALAFDDMITALKDRRNDLLAPARAVSPVIGDVLSALQADENCVLARLSGSGGTCFGLFAAAEDAHEAVGRIASEHPDWWCVATTFRDAPPEIQFEP